MTNRLARNVRTAIVLGGAAAMTAASLALSPHPAPPAPKPTAPAWIADAPIVRCAWEDGSDSARPCYWSDSTGDDLLYGADGSFWRQHHDGEGWQLDTLE